MRARLAAGVAEAWRLGLGEPVPISAAHGEGMVDLHDALLSAAEDLGLAGVLTGEDDLLFAAEEGSEEPIDEEERFDEDGNPIEVWQDDSVREPMRIAIVGRPNMGKSTLINSLIGEDRLLTGPEAGHARCHRGAVRMARPAL